VPLVSDTVFRSEKLAFVSRVVESGKRGAGWVAGRAVDSTRMFPISGYEASRTVV